METKHCNKCNTTLPTTQFFKRGDGKGLRSFCKKCHGHVPDKVCPVCNTIHTGYSNGRKSNVCSTCYPKYRQAYNLLHAAEYRAKKKNLEFSLTIEWLLERFTSCPKTGMPFTYLDNGNNYRNRKVSTPSIDKIDPSKGYTQENCQVVCWWYNVSKQQFTEQEVYNLCKAVVISYVTNNVQPVQQMEETERKIT